MTTTPILPSDLTLDAIIAAILRRATDLDIIDLAELRLEIDELTDDTDPILHALALALDDALDLLDLDDEMLDDRFDDIAASL